VDAPTGTVAIEAEGATGLQPPFRVVADDECSGGTCIGIPRGAGKSGQAPAKAVYAVQIARKAVYRAWLRVKWTDGDGNSLFLVLPGKEPAIVGQDGTYGRWHWVPGHDAELSEGAHSVPILHREDGVYLDRILLVPDAAFVPRGARGVQGPSGWLANDIYFADDFSRTDEAPAHVWEHVSGDWKVNYTLDPNKLPNFCSYVGSAEKEGIAVAGYRFWKDYRIDVAIQPLTCGAAGIVFCFVDPQHYLLARWAKDAAGKGRLELCRVAGGDRRVVKSVEVPRFDGLWSLLSVRAWSDELAIVLDDHFVLEEKGIPLSGGKVGLFVSQGSAAFDNVEVSPIRRFRGSMARDSRWWEAVRGKWSSDGASLTGKGHRAGAAVTGEPGWRDYEVRTEVQRTSRPWGIVACWTSPEDSYQLEVTESVLAITRRQGGERTVLASTELPGLWGGEWQSFAFRRVGAHLGALVGGQLVLEAWDDGLRHGRAGLAAGSWKEVRFRTFEVEFLEPDLFSGQIEAFSFVQPTVIDPTDVPDLTPEQYRETVESERSALLRRNARHHAVIGADRSGALWAISAGQWSISAEQLHATPGNGEALLFLNRPVPGDMAVAAEALPAAGATGEIGLVAHGSRRDCSQGYRLVLEAAGKRLALYRAQKEVASSPVSPVAERAMLELRCSGSHVLGWVDRNLKISYVDPEPLDGEEVGLLAVRGPAHFDEVSVHSLNYRGRKLWYAFDRPATDWLPAGGEFRLHAGVSCFPASSWLSMLGEQGDALMWNKKAFEGDISVSLKAMEHTIWFGWDKSPSHQHTVYRNLGISLCADGKDVASSYAVIVNGWNLQRSVLTRKGEVVASVVQGKDFPCQLVGGHSPVSPRSCNIRLEKRGDTLRLLVNGVPVLRYTDPEPLGGGMAGIWCWDALMNIADVHITASRVRPGGLAELKEMSEAGAASVGRLVKQADKGLSRQAQ
jgi:hypothetical protein